MGKDPVEEGNELLRVQPLGERRGADDVREKHRRALICVGDRALTGLEPDRDLTGQYVQKQLLRAFLLTCERVHGAVALAEERRDQDEHNRAPYGDVEA